MSGSINYYTDTLFLSVCVYWHVSFGNAVDGHCMLGCELFTAMFIITICNGGSFPVPSGVIVDADAVAVVFDCYGRIQSGWRRNSTCSGQTRNFTRRYAALDYYHF